MNETEPGRVDEAAGLLDGIRRFRESVLPGMADRFAELAGGQAPPVLLVTCADSRIDPNLITQSEPGTLFVARNPGNLIPPAAAGGPTGEAASIEYAVRALGVVHLVVCGHSGCGAMAAVAQPDAVADLPAVAAWISHAADTVEEPARDLIESNVARQLRNARTHPSVAAAEAEGRLRLHGWVYDIGTGAISARGDDGIFTPLAG